MSPAMAKAMHAMTRPEKVALIKGHPDLAGKLALAGDMTEDSKREQGSAGLDRLTPAELARFTELNDTYKARFGFPFIFAVKGRTKADILAAFEKRIGNTEAAEFDEALRQIERITFLRLEQRLA